MDIKLYNQRLSATEYIDFLKRTDLGSQYPKERFEQRIEKLVKSASISIVARDGDKVVGVIFGITDFAYWLFVTDLGVDRDYTRLGIGSMLMKEAHKAAGGEDSINVYLCANEDAIEFYEKLGMRKSTEIMEYCHAEWTDFTVE